MLRRIVADHQPWLGSTSAELGYTGLEQQTALHTYTHTDGSTHDVLVIDGRKDGNGPTILKSTSLDYRINPFLVRQETINAHQLGARIAISEIPGISGMPLNAKGELDLSVDIDKKKFDHTQISASLVAPVRSRPLKSRCCDAKSRGRL